MSAPTRQFHITQDGEVYHMNRSVDLRSQLSESRLVCTGSTPPCECTMPFGRPVVPEENITHSGCSEGTCNGSYAWSPATICSNGTVSSSPCRAG